MIRTFTTNAFTSIAAALPIAMGFYLEEITSADPLLSLITRTTRAAAPLISYLIAKKVQTTYNTENGSIFVGMSTAALMVFKPEATLKLAVSMIALAGSGGCLFK
jgi:hypothetical protein